MKTPTTDEVSRPSGPSGQSSGAAQHELSLVEPEPSPASRSPDQIQSAKGSRADGAGIGARGDTYQGRRQRVNAPAAGLTGVTAVGDTYTKRDKPKPDKQGWGDAVASVAAALFFPFRALGRLYRFNRRLARIVTFSAVYFVGVYVFMHSEGYRAFEEFIGNIDEEVEGGASPAEVMKVGQDVSAAMKEFDVNRLAKPEGMSDEAFAKQQARVDKILKWIGRRVLNGSDGPSERTLDIKAIEEKAKQLGIESPTIEALESATKVTQAAVDASAAPTELKQLADIAKGKSVELSSIPAPSQQTELAAAEELAGEQSLDAGLVRAASKGAVAATDPAAQKVAPAAQQVKRQATAPTPPKPVPALAKLEYDAALAAVKAGNDAKALQHLRVALALAPDFDDAQELLTNRAVAVGLQAVAINVLERCLESAPGQWRTGVRLAVLLTQRQQFARAREILEANPPEDSEQLEYASVLAYVRAVSPSAPPASGSPERQAATVTSPSTSATRTTTGSVATRENAASKKQ